MLVTLEIPRLLLSGTLFRRDYKNSLLVGITIVWIPEQIVNEPCYVKDCYYSRDSEEGHFTKHGNLPSFLGPKP